jgi:hypothetical protein
LFSIVEKVNSFCFEILVWFFLTIIDAKLSLLRSMLCKIRKWDSSAFALWTPASEKYTFDEF